MSKETNIKARLHYFQDLVCDIDELPGNRRARLRAEMVEFYDSLDPTKRIAKYAGAGAVAAGILPGIGWIAGGLMGAAYAALNENDVETKARDEMGKLIAQFG